MTTLDFKLNKLSQERLMYSERIGNIVGLPDCDGEIAAYIVMIHQINEAAITVARQACRHVLPGTGC